MTTVHILPCMTDNYIYLIEAPGGQVAVVDPGESAPVLTALKDKNLTASLVLNTHHHSDHIAGNEEIKTTYKAALAAPRKDQHNISGIDHFLEEGTCLPFGDEEIIVLETPGHTLGHIALYLPSAKAVFTGDTLFAMGCGRLFGGTAQMLFSSLQKLKTLPDETRVYCGHEYTLSNALWAAHVLPDHAAIKRRLEEIKALRASNIPTIPSTIGLEKATNPFMLAQTVEEFARLRTHKDTFKS